MAEPSRIQLQMMLVQQAGPAALPLSILPPQEFLPFLRQVEELAIDARLKPVLVYWSRQKAARLLPKGPRFRDLMRDAECVSIFSEDHTDPPDEWGFLLESHGLCLFVYGQQAHESPDGEKYQCTGSMDPAIVKQSFDRLQPKWSNLDRPETNRLEDARAKLGPSGSALPYMQRIRSAWPIKKVPIQTGLILDPLQGLSFPEIIHPSETPPFPPGTDPGRVSPIAIDLNPKGAPPALGAAPILSPGGAVASIATADPAVSVPTDGGGAVVEDTRKGQDNRDDGDQVSILPPAAQTIINEIIGRLRHSRDLNTILQYAIETLVKAANADRGLIWQIEGDHLQVTNEYTGSGHNAFVNNQLSPQESTAIVLEFLSRFPDETGAGVISIPNTANDTNFHKVSPTLSSLIELGGVNARLMAQLRSRGVFSGFLELQQCSGARDWSTVDAVVLQKVAEVLSVVVQQSADQGKIEMDAQEMKLINEIGSLFRESRGMSTRDSLVKSVMLVAEHMGFAHSEIYLHDRGENVLRPQTSDSEEHSVDSDSEDNPFVEVFKSGRGKMINMEYSRKGDPYFKHDIALVLPLTSEGARLGVIGLWQRLPNRPDFRPQDRELGLTIAGHLSNVIRADQAIQQIRSDQTRAAIINRVTSGIRKALMQADQIMETLVEALIEYFELSLCVGSLFDAKTDSFAKSKVAGDAPEPDRDENEIPALEGKEHEPANLGEHLFEVVKEELKQGQTIFLTREELEDRLSGRNVKISEECKSATLVPLFYAGNFKAALCMVSENMVRPLSDKDEHFVLDLADRVAVVISHAELFTQVKHESITDAMTGLFNRRHFESQLSKEIDRYQRFGHVFSFIIIDLDYLKRINDNLGHHFGDAAIKHIGKVLKKSVREIDTVGRFGGEEFVVLLPETDLKWAKMVAERICSSIREKPVEGVGTITASLGVAVFPNDADDKEKLFELADKALYLAKQRGRNRVCTVADDLMRSGGALAITDKDKLEIDNRGREKVKVRLDDSLPSFDLEMIAEKGILGLLAQIVKSLEEKDAYGSERSPRVYGYASRMAQSLHLSKEHAEIVSLAAVLSNLGKIAVPEEVLQKPGPLTDDEMELIRQAPAVGAKILEPAKLLHRVSQIVEAYHEHWDGTGYPNGLRGHDIPVEAQIVSLVDTFTAMTSDRPWRERLGKEEAIELIKEDSGKRWDSRLVKIFLSILQKEDKED